MILSRRNFLKGLLAAPAVIAIDRLMPIKMVDNSRILALIDDLRLVETPLGGLSMIELKRVGVKLPIFKMPLRPESNWRFMPQIGNEIVTSSGRFIDDISIFLRDGKPCGALAWYDDHTPRGFVISEEARATVPIYLDGKKIGVA